MNNQDDNGGAPAPFRTGRILPDLNSEARDNQNEWLLGQMDLSRSQTIARVAEMIVPVRFQARSKPVSARPLGTTSGVDHDNFHQTYTPPRKVWKKRPGQERTVYDQCMANRSRRG